MKLFKGTRQRDDLFFMLRCRGNVAPVGRISSPSLSYHLQASFLGLSAVVKKMLHKFTGSLRRLGDFLIADKGKGIRGAFMDTDATADAQIRVHYSRLAELVSGLQGNL
ncbi:MAG: hypothetical protein SV375_19480, partial [Thermodesulfobacteriota bacterium]|nr:hypothetical protein [Thermodesulfobacteriota bacterium]